MYTDRRFSRHAPLKEYMYIRFREPFREQDVLGLYFDMGCGSYSYGIRIYKQTSAGMDRVRNGVLENEKAYASELSCLNKLGFVLNGDMFARDHFPGVKNETVKSLLNRKNFYVVRNCLISDAVFTGKLQSEISAAYTALKSFYFLLKKSL